MNDIAVFQKETDEHDDKIDKKEDDGNREIRNTPSASGDVSESVPPPKKKKKNPVKQKVEMNEEPLETDKKPVKKKQRQGQGQPLGEAAADNHLNPPSGELEEMDVEETTPKPEPKPKPKPKPKPIDDE
jgi:hypothetical protein